MPSHVTGFALSIRAFSLCFLPYLAASETHDKLMRKAKQPPYGSLDVEGAEKPKVPDPPVDLAPARQPSPDEVNLGSGPASMGDMFLHVGRNILSWTGPDVTVANAAGRYLYATYGDILTLRMRTHLYSVQPEKEVALLTKTFWSLHDIYEIASLSPLCPDHERTEGDRPTDGYPYARLTKLLLSLTRHYVLERYNCDGSLEPVWEIESRYYLSFMYHYDIKASGAPLPIGTIDQSAGLQFTNWSDAWVRGGEDLNLFSAVAILVDMDYLLAEASSAGAGFGVGASRR